MQDRRAKGGRTHDEVGWTSSSYLDSIKVSRSLNSHAYILYSKVDKHGRKKGKEEVRD